MNVWDLDRYMGALASALNRVLSLNYQTGHDIDPRRNQGLRASRGHYKFGPAELPLPVWECGGEVKGNNATAICPVCSTAYLAPSYGHAEQVRACPTCGQTQIRITKGADPEYGEGYTGVVEEAQRDE